MNWPNITASLYTRSKPLLQTKRIRAVSYGWPQHSLHNRSRTSLLHILHPSCHKFYKRVHWKYIKAGHNFIAPENLCAFWIPDVNKCPNPNTQPERISKIDVTSWRKPSFEPNPTVTVHVATLMNVIEHLFLLFTFVIRMGQTRLKRSAHVSLLSLYEFRKNRLWEDRRFLWP